MKIEDSGLRITLELLNFSGRCVRGLRRRRRRASTVIKLSHIQHQKQFRSRADWARTLPRLVRDLTLTPGRGPEAEAEGNMLRCRPAALQAENMVITSVWQE